METFLERLYKLGLIKKPVGLTDSRGFFYLESMAGVSREKVDLNKDTENITEVFSRYFNKNTYDFISGYADLGSSGTHIVSTIHNFSIEQLPAGRYEAIVNLNRINDIRRVNKFFELVNDKLPQSGLFIGCCETLELRHKKLLKKYPFLLNRVILLMDYVFKRVFPKLPFTKKVYFMLTGGRNRIISRAETLGRLYSCGFEIVDEKPVGNLHYFVARKKDKPTYDLNPSYGMFFPMVRTGKNGKTIRVYKIRTMYPFSEYIQAYIYEINHLEKGGKFMNDFRVTTMGRIMRKFWIDELPMILNLLKGELKIVGIRPLSKQFQSLYPEELLTLRHKTKPGLVPPYYADMPSGLGEIVESEKKYLLAYQKAPLKTDWKYFWKAFYNIIFKNARSK